MTPMLAASLKKKFGPVLKSQETFPTLGAYLSMRYPVPRVRKVRDAFSLRSKDCKLLAGML